MHPRIKSTLLFLAASLLLGVISQASKNNQHSKEITSGPAHADTSAHKLSEPLVWKVTDKEIVFKFPAQVQGKNITGSVHFTNTANRDINRTYHFSPGKGPGRSISTELLKKGEYNMYVEWTADHCMYYTEGLLSLK